MSNTRQLLFTRGTVWSVSTSKWTGTDRLHAEDIGKLPEDIQDNIVLGKKYMLPDDWKNKLATPAQQVQALMQKFGKNFLDIRGVYFVPDQSLMLVREGLSRIEERALAITEDFIREYPEIKSSRIEAYPNLQDAKWPTPDQIRKYFKIKTVVFEVSEASINATDPEELIEAKRKFAQELHEEFDLMKENILTEAHNAIVQTCAELSNKIIDAGASITEATLKKPRRVIEDYLAVAELFDSEDVKNEVNRLKTLIDEADPRSLRLNYRAADEFGNSLRAMAESIGDLAGLTSEGRVKRAVNF
jgi:hypothetical protein